MYNPDNWVVLKITYNNQRTFKVLGGWSGSYLYGDSWRLNSGVVRVEETEHHWDFIGHSGSVYHCHKDRYGISMSIGHVIKDLQDRFGDDVKVMEEKTFWSEVNYD